MEQLWPIRKNFHEKAQAFDSFAQMPGFFLIVANMKFELLFANDYFFNFFECKPDDLLGKSLYNFLNDDVNLCIDEEHIRTVINEGFKWEYKSTTAKPNGEPLTVKWNQTYLHDKKNPIIITLGLLHEDDKINVDFIASDLIETDEDIKLIEPVPPPGIYNSSNMSILKSAVSDQEIQYALEHNTFELYYQPLIHARTKSIIGAEALLRMNHPTRGRLFPMYVLPTAEKTGQIIAIGHFVINAACKKIKEWSLGGRNLTISVNLSYKQFLNDDLAETILRAVTLHDVAAGHLLLDITEDIISRDPDKTREIIRTLRQLGCKICLDDFGTGFSSLKNLETMEIDNIKIDRSFLPNKNNNRKAYALLESIIMLSHGLGFSVTTSGIETEQQAETLLEMSCDHFQGYLFSHPVSEKDFDRLLDTPEFYVRNV